MKILRRFFSRCLSSLKPESLIRFKVNRVLSGVEFPNSPMLDAEKLELLNKYVSKADKVLEFGSGGSSLSIARFVNS